MASEGQWEEGLGGGKEDVGGDGGSRVGDPSVQVEDDDYVQVEGCVHVLGVRICVLV